MNKLTWIIYGILALYFIGTFVFTVHDHYLQITQFDQIRIADIDLDYILLKIITGYFIAIPFLLLGLIGLIYKGFAGWIFLLSYPFLAIIYKLYFGFSWTRMEPAEFIVPLVIILLINSPGFRKMYEVKKLKNAFLGNSIAIMMGISLCVLTVIHYQIGS